MLKKKVSRLLDKFKGKKQRSRFLFHAALEAGYTPPEIRRGLLAFYNVRLSRLAVNQPFGKDLLYAVRDGYRQNRTAMELLANAVDMDVDEMFPEEWTSRRRTAA